jgi:hypothetical protein
MSSGLTTERSYRVLWAQVVLQAKEDLVEEPIGSLLYNDAKAFFLSGGEWARSRTNIADCLEMHPDDLGRCGKRWIAERRARDGLPPELSPPPSPRAPVKLPLPRLVAVPAPDKRARNGGRRVIPAGINPFSQCRIRSAA